MSEHPRTDAMPSYTIAVSRGKEPAEFPVVVVRRDDCRQLELDFCELLRLYNKVEQELGELKRRSPAPLYCPLCGRILYHDASREYPWYCSSSFTVGPGHCDYEQQEGVQMKQQNPAQGSPEDVPSCVGDGCDGKCETCQRDISQ